MLATGTNWTSFRRKILSEHLEIKSRDKCGSFYEHPFTFGIVLLRILRSMRTQITRNKLTFWCLYYSCCIFVSQNVMLGIRKIIESSRYHAAGDFLWRFLSWSHKLENSSSYIRKVHSEWCTMSCTKTVTRESQFARACDMQASYFSGIR